MYHVVHLKDRSGLESASRDGLLVPVWPDLAGLDALPKNAQKWAKISVFYYYYQVVSNKNWQLPIFTSNGPQWPRAARL